MFANAPTRRAALGMFGGASLPLLASLGSCAGWRDLRRPGPADPEFEAIAARAIDGIARVSPIGATLMGDHRFDAELDDISDAGRRTGGDFRRVILASLEGLNTARLSNGARVDAAMLKNRLQFDLWEQQSSQSWTWDPLPYTEAAGDSLYALMARDFAPLYERMQSTVARMEKLPGFLAQARENLVLERVPRIHAETLARRNPGVMSIVTDMVMPNADTLGGRDRARLTDAAEALSRALTDHQKWIDETLLPNARGSFRLGARLYDEKLALALHAPMSREQIRTRAEAKMAQIREEMAELAGQIVSPPANERWTAQRHIRYALERAANDRPARADLERTCREALRRATDFVREQDLITLPDAPVNVITMPEFLRGAAVAYCDPPGPLERHLDTFYAVSPIPDAWNDEQAQSFLREYNRRSIEELTIHEAMPGHYVQLWHSNKYPSTTRAAFWSGTFVEGWASYAQDMMFEAGYQDADPVARLVNRKWALRVIANAILDQAVHVDGASEAEAMALMTEQTFQEEREAAGKWTRARITAAQLPTYFVGWTEHHEARAEAEQRWGEDFALKRYHDQILSFGSPPMRYARALMFGEEIEI